MSWAAAARRCFSWKRLLWLLAAAALLGAALTIPRLLHPDVLAGRSYVLSSEGLKCDVARGRCGGVSTRIFFHTNDELRPFIQYDLGRTTRLRRVEVSNRRDAVAERAVPLVIQASLDGQHWQELARREHWFEFWRADFAPTNARYLKLFVDRRTILHLERVQAWE